MMAIELEGTETRKHLSFGYSPPHTSAQSKGPIPPNLLIRPQSVAALSTFSFCSPHQIRRGHFSGGSLSGGGGGGGEGQ